MTITELITALEAVRAEHGDLPVMTPGFDECDLDPVSRLELSHARKKPRPGNHCGDYEEWTPYPPAPVPARGWFKCLSLNF